MLLRCNTALLKHDTSISNIVLNFVLAHIHVMGDSSQFSPLTTLSEQLGPNSWVSSVFISAFIANIGNIFPLNMTQNIPNQFKTSYFIIFSTFLLS